MSSGAGAWTGGGGGGVKAGGGAGGAGGCGMAAGRSGAPLSTVTSPAAWAFAIAPGIAGTPMIAAIINMADSDFLMNGTRHHGRKWFIH